MKNMLHKFVKNNKGQTMTEYALILAVIAIGVIGVMTLLGDEVRAAFQAIVDAF